MEEESVEFIGGSLEFTEDIRIDGHREVDSSLDSLLNSFHSTHLLIYF